jgi:hypothetical protein
MMSVRGALACISYHGYVRVYAIGGTNGKSCLCSVEKYDPTTNAWMQIPDMSQRRMDFCTAVIGDTIFVIGGLQDGIAMSAMSSVECYNEKSTEWIAA